MFEENPFRFTKPQFFALISVLLVQSDIHYRDDKDLRPILDLQRRGENEWVLRSSIKGYESLAILLRASFHHEQTATPEELDQHALYITRKIEEISGVYSPDDPGKELSFLDWKETVIILGFMLGITVLNWKLDHFWPRSDKDIEATHKSLMAFTLFGSLEKWEFEHALSSLDLLFQNPDELPIEASEEDQPKAKESTRPITSEDFQAKTEEETGQASNEPVEESRPGIAEATETSPTIGKERARSDMDQPGTTEHGYSSARRKRASTGGRITKVPRQNSDVESSDR